MSNLIYISPDNVRANRDRNKQPKTFKVLKNPIITDNLLNVLPNVYSDFAGSEGELYSIKELLNSLSNSYNEEDIEYLKSLLKQQITHILV